MTWRSWVEKMNVVPNSPIDLLHQIQNALAGLAVEVGGRLVRQHDARIDRQGPGNSHPLALPAAQLIRHVVGISLQPHHLQRYCFTRLRRSSG